MKKAVLGLVVAAAVLGVVMLFRGGTDGPSLPTDQAMASPAAKGAGRQSPDVVLTITPGVPDPKRAAPPAPRASPLMQEYASKKGRKALYDRLSQLSSRTAEEGYVLAEVMSDCREMSRMKKLPKPLEQLREDKRRSSLASISDRDPAKEKRIAAWDAMSSGGYACAGFEDTNFTREDIRTAMAKAAEAGDARARARLIEIDAWAPLMGPDGFSYRGPNSKLPSLTDAQLAGLREALSSNDPAAIMAAARLLSSTLGDLQIRTGPDERAVDPRAFYDAWSLVACDAGRDCGPQHEQILGGCFAFGNCDAHDLREYMFLYGNSPQQSQLVAEYEAQITRAIQSGDWSYFQFHRGPPPVGMVMARPPP
jgi:hypothetical protein